MTNSRLVTKAKIALRLNSTAYDEQIDDLISAAKLDLKISGVNLPAELDAICNTAVITYVCLHFGQPEDYDKLKASYDEQKAQLRTATGYNYRGLNNV